MSLAENDNGTIAGTYSSTCNGNSGDLSLQLQ